MVNMKDSLNILGVSKRKNGVANDQYFQNSNTQQCNIFRHTKYNLQLVVCEVSTSYMSNVMKVMNVRRIMGQTGLR